VISAAKSATLGFQNASRAATFSRVVASTRAPRMIARRLDAATDLSPPLLL
jgi:hypothetical protein